MPKAQPPKPTDAELAILRVLWELGPSTVRRVQEAINEQRETGYTTVLKLLQIMTVWMLVTGWARRVGRVVHATSQVRVVGVLVLVIEAEGVADLLAHHQTPVRGGVVLRLIKVRVVDLYVGPTDVVAGGDRYGGDTQPARVAVANVADLDVTGGGVAADPAAERAGHHRRVEHDRGGPVRRRLGEVGSPGGGNVPVQLQRERVRRSGPKW